MPRGTRSAKYGKAQNLDQDDSAERCRFVGATNIGKIRPLQVVLKQNGEPRRALRCLGLPAIAQSPFTNISGDPEQEHLDGMSEDIIRALSKLRGAP